RHRSACRDLSPDRRTRVRPGRQATEGGADRVELLPGAAARLRSHRGDVPRTPRCCAPGRGRRRAQPDARGERRRRTDAMMRGSESARRYLAVLGPWLGLIAVWTLFALAVGQPFWAWENQRLMLQQTAIVGTAAVGATFVIVSGGIDLAVGSTIALLTVVLAKPVNAGWPDALAPAGVVASGAVIG